jgi:hypothetical protein
LHGDEVVNDGRRILKKEKLQEDNSRKAALHALVEMITAYPDRK